MLEKLPDVVGEVLGDVRAGLSNTLFHTVDLRQGMAALKLASLAFVDHAPMPQQYTADGQGLSPPLHWSGVPVQSTEVLLIVEDADSPTPQPLVHAIAHGLPVGGGHEGGSGGLAEGALSDVGDTEPLVAMGRNSLLQSVWLPPDPPPGHGVHRYVFQLFALGPGEPLPDTPNWRDKRALSLRRVRQGIITAPPPESVQEYGMAKPTIETLAARLDVQAIVLQELARVLKPDQAATVADAVRLRVAELAGRDLSHAADAAVAGELVLLLDALTPR